jgi:hypothetical protein
MRNWFFGLLALAALGLAGVPSHSTPTANPAASPVSSPVSSPVASPVANLAAGSAAGPAANAPVILTVEGRVGNGPAEFTRADLEALGQATIRTTTPWHDGVQTFEGVPLAALMDRIAAKGGKVELVALNKYRTTIPAEDFARHQPILALKRNGNYMEVRDKGPLFVIYPYDAKAELRSEQYFGRSAWQVRTIIVQ